MNKIKTLIMGTLTSFIMGCSSTSVDDITSTADGAVVTVTADGSGGTFDGEVDKLSDLDDLLTTAYGESHLGIHRGHAPIENVLEAFLGIDHDEMHVLMDEGFNLAAICLHFGFDPQDLVESLTISFLPFLEEGVANGVLTSAEVPEWTSKIREQFSLRVSWED